MHTRFINHTIPSPCLFIAPNMFYVIDIDNCLFFTKDSTIINSTIDNLKTEFNLVPETNVSAFLRIKMKNLVTLTWPQLIKNTLQTVNMVDCHAKATPTALIPLGKNDTGPAWKENWSYSSVIGMLLYLVSNTHPDLAFTVNQAAHYTHRPHQIHEEAIKCICQYLQGSKNQLFIITSFQFTYLYLLCRCWFCWLMEIWRWPRSSVCSIPFGLCNHVHQLPSSLGQQITNRNSSLYHGGWIYSIVAVHAWLTSIMLFNFRNSQQFTFTIYRKLDSLQMFWRQQWCTYPLVTTPKMSHPDILQ